MPPVTPERISLRAIWWSAVQLRQRAEGRYIGAEVIPDFISSEVLREQERCVRATKAGSPDIELAAKIGSERERETDVNRDFTSRL